jgi:hypothetical protein
MKTWGTNVGHAFWAWIGQTILAIDQLLNPLFIGFFSFLAAICTGKRQDVAYADETPSAHAYRGFNRGRILARIGMPIVDLLFFWQPQDDEVNAAAGRPVPSHCERAFWKEKLRRNLPPEYRDVN